MTLTTFFELQRARAASISDKVVEDIRKQQFQRATGDHLEHAPEPYVSGRTRTIDHARGNYIRWCMRYE